MPHKKLSEYRSKRLLHAALGLEYVGWEFKPGSKNTVKGFNSYVLKVDQAVKGRFKKGLVKLNIKKKELTDQLIVLRHKGYESFIVEPYVIHASDSERYLSITNDREGICFTYSDRGGIDIESQTARIWLKRYLQNDDVSELATSTHLTSKQLEAIIHMVVEQHIVFLEINPYFLENNELFILDAAIEVDAAALPFVDGWTERDFRNNSMSNYKEEVAISSLNHQSSASFNLSVLNKNGSIFLLLSGGGASVVVADIVHDKGYGKELANYGEYSGNPSVDEVFIYTSELIKLLLSSNASKKVLFVGGAVANFTDIATTFSGIIKAFYLYATKLEKSNLKVFVRRGGPHQESGLANITSCLTSLHIYGGVYDPTTTITKAVENTLKALG
jgi:succinyl-CoA synthetase beta subunit